MERLPPTQFGRTLRTLIREKWGTQAKLATQVSVDNSWITKVIRGDQVSLTYLSLQKLLAGFSRQGDREQLYQAWLETYAPSPLDQSVPDQWSRDEQIIQYATSVHDLISAGKVLPTFQVLKALWKHLEHHPRRGEVAFEVGHALVDTANQLDRIGVSVKVSDEMAKHAASAREPAWVAVSLWLKSVSLRHLRPRDLEQVEEAFRAFGSYLGHWQPTSGSGKTVKGEIVQCFLRDQVLAGLDAFYEKAVDSENFIKRIASLKSRMDGLRSSAEVGMANEVLARALIAAGRVEEAVEPLHVAGSHATSKPNQLKVQICRVQFLAADGQHQEAQGSLDNAVEFADSFHLVHHRHKLACLEQGLRAESHRTHSFPIIEESLKGKVRFGVEPGLNLRNSIKVDRAADLPSDRESCLRL